MRTTISPEQLEILYKKYGENSNPSRNEMETIANSVGLSRRVVQVWYQNTRARQRRGQCRVIGNTVYHCKCPYCDTICKSKSHLSQHVQKEHSDRAKNAIQIGSASAEVSHASAKDSAPPPNVTISSKQEQMAMPLVASSNHAVVASEKPLESLVASVSSIVNAATKNFGASLQAIDDLECKNGFNSSLSNGKSLEEVDETKLNDVSFYSDASK